MPLCSPSRSARLVLRAAATIFAFHAAPHGAHAQVVVQEPGHTVEVVGLRTWTLEMLQDSLDTHAPGMSLASHACAAVLRYELGFADASFTMHNRNGVRHAIIAVVEPQDSARVHYRAVEMDTLGARPEWRIPIEILRTDPMAFQHALNAYSPNSAGQWPLRGTADSPAARAVLEFLREQDDDADLQIALATLRSDPNFHNRMVAAAVLSNFADRDEAWRALMEALRETDGPVKGIASNVLGEFAQSAPRPVDWEPSTSTIHALLDGTSLFSTRTVFRVLRATAGEPRWAAPFLADGGTMLLAYLQSTYVPVRDNAHGLLVALSGRDLGYDAEAWRAWIGTLE